MARVARVALNGLGRIGKLLLRDLAANGLLDELVLVNDPVGDAALHAHLLEFDSVHGRWDADIGHDGGGHDGGDQDGGDQDGGDQDGGDQDGGDQDGGDQGGGDQGGETLIIAGRRVRLTHARTIETLPLAALDVDVVIDCSGAYRTAERLAPYFEAGVARVVVSAPVRSEGALNVVYGVNHDAYDPGRHRIVTAASCTTNCLAPVVKVLHEGIGIRHGSITTIHDVTNTQTLVDRPASDARRARSALNSLIPTTTGSATAITLIYPELAGRLNGHAVRVPLLNASLTDGVFEMARATTVEEVNGLFETAARGELAGILGYETRPLVSADYVDDPRSGIVDAMSTMVVAGTQVKVYVWYDNEWGYACRLGDVARLVAEGA